MLAYYVMQSMILTLYCHNLYNFREGLINMKGLILSAGMGLRTRPISYSIPKPLIPIANKATFLYAVESLKNCCVKDIGLVINKEHLNNFEQVIKNSNVCEAINIAYIFQPRPQGIAHAISCAKEFIKDDSFIVQLGDNIIFHNYQSFCKGNKRCKILLAPVNDISRYGIAELDNGKIVNLVEKPKQSKSNLAMVGLYLFTPEIFRFIDELVPSARGEYEITQAIFNMLTEYKEIDFDVCDIWWKDTGTPHDILDANRYILANVLKSNTDVKESSSLTNVSFGSSVSIGEKCDLNNCGIDNSIILNNVIIKNINISDSIIGDNCIITRSKGMRPLARLLLGNDCSVRLGVD